MHSEPELPPLPDDDPDGTREWRKLRGSVRHQTVGMLGEIFALLRILLQDAVILVAGFAVEFAFEHWLHSEQPFFKLAINISSAMFLLLYGVMVTVHVVHYVKEQFGTTAAAITGNWLHWGVTAAAVIAAVIMYNMSSSHGGNSLSEPKPVSRVAINLPPGQRLAGLDQPAIAISSDGKNIVYVASQNRAREQEDTPDARRSLTGASTQLYLRPLDSDEARPIVGTDGAMSPFFSPDGQWIGFFAGGKLKKIPVNGGAAITLGSAPIPGGASWGANGSIAFQPSSMTLGLSQISQEGGEAKLLTKLVKGESLHKWPSYLPDGKTLLFAGSAAFASWTNAQITLLSGASDQRRLSVTGYQPQYASSGHLLFAQSGMLMAMPFDVSRQVLTNGAIAAIEGVMQSSTTGAAQYSVSRTGTLVYVSGVVAGGQSRLVWVSREGKEEVLPAAPHIYQFPRVSPDGRRVVMSIAEEETNIWIYDVSRDTLTRQTFEGGVNNNAGWSPDGRRIVFGSDRNGPRNLYWQAADGSGKAERLTTSETLHSANAFSPDGQLLAFIDITPDTGRDIAILDVKSGKATSFLRTPNEDTSPAFSPDGKWLAYSSDESGQREIYVQPYPGPGGKWQISTDGGQEPMWNPKGGELFYRTGNRLMAVGVDTTAGFSAGKPHILFEGAYLPTGASLPYYDVAPDGKRFLMLKPVASQANAPTQINVVQNWFEELKQKVPVQ